MHLRLKSVTSYVPKNIEFLSDNYESFGMTQTEAQVFQRFYGVNAIPVSNDSALSLMINAAKPLVEKLTEDEKKKIKYLVVPRTSASQEMFGVTSVRQLAQFLQLENAIPFSTSLNKCVSLLRAFEISKTLLQNEDAGSMALIVAGEPVFANVGRVLPSISVAGDGSAAVLVDIDKEGDHRWLSSTMISLNDYSEGMWMSTAKVSEFGRLFEPVMLKTAMQALEKARLSWEDIKVILPHNVNVPCWKGFAKFAKLPLEKIYLKNIATASHCFNADWLINWCSIMEENILQKGDYYMMATVAVGAVFGVGIFQY